MQNIYTSGQYLDSTATWHAEDSDWKAGHILRLLDRNNLSPGTVIDVGCGAGGILRALARAPKFTQAHLLGYDISPQAIELAKQSEYPNLSFRCGDALAEGVADPIDLLLAIDVFEHVPDYMGFLEKCRAVSTYQIYHVPLEIHVSAVLRESVTKGRYSVGHLHYFTPRSALEVLRDTGHDVLDSFFTDQAVALFRTHPSVKKALANVPRWILSRFSPAIASRILGGYSLMVLTRAATADNA